MYKPYCLNFRLKSELEKEPIKILLMYTLDADADMRSSFFIIFCSYIEIAILTLNSVE